MPFKASSYPKENRYLIDFSFIEDGKLHYRRWNTAAPTAAVAKKRAIQDAAHYKYAGFKIIGRITKAK